MAGITNGIEEPIKIIGYADDGTHHTPTPMSSHTSNTKSNKCNYQMSGTHRIQYIDGENQS
jgi:hypothetical protein